MTTLYGTHSTQDQANSKKGDWELDQSYMLDSNQHYAFWSLKLGDLCQALNEHQQKA